MKILNFENYPILHKLFELCPFMEGFFLAHSHSSKISNFDIILPYKNNPIFGAILTPSYISHCENDATEFHVMTFTIKFGMR